ncbi:hypothetical protein [Polyangium jinanense]|uniref:Uncharacterized protein n=1 Tax=Polyangium jinanense TaxID=2829994 RepID=A0A9X3X5I9_9BACT|nr:hypothetical protein [Polyangium jinanense]MDC3983125.1 hypothetical protein [Polyangium jinanense]
MARAERRRDDQGEGQEAAAPRRLKAARAPTARPRVSGKWTQIALLLRRLADLIEAPEGDEPGDNRPRRRPVRFDLPPPPPIRPPSELDMQRATEDLRRLGYKINK